MARAEAQTRAARSGVNTLITAALALIPTAMFVTGGWQFVILAALVAVILGSAAAAFIFTRLGERTWNQLAHDDLPALQRGPTRSHSGPPGIITERSLVGRRLPPWR
ncbi:hypothetical protein G7085_20465 [Tessaracoccus sp. HDW20]|uniref:hypothetical protein n=1 Tax=Tessaracoccus coleopterorum TaxID=2714950 RepID=UPI0018D3E2ED|nr:hypothetical protein [Tessaracoccus coleopterorum]NHB86097.1 hypothetical protein [Tessaracoccus coleopterorum]